MGSQSGLENARKTILAGGAEPSPGDLLAQLSERLENGVVPVINGTGVVLHTNLGRAPWAAQAQKDALAAMSYAAVEVDARTGKRGRRGGSVEDRLCALVGSQAALIVNNCAAAVLLALRTFARNRPVLISRGELVEIGGGYRVPEVLEESGARMLEVGTTNKTHLRDYEKALSSPEGKNGLVLKVHQSNFRQEGFVSRPDTKSLVALGVDVIVDLGSGSLDATVETPTIQTLVEDGAPIVCFSGDKLLGGPQAGIVVGHRETIEAMRACPLYRAIRPDKVTLAGLSGTLDSWLTDTQVPIWEMMSLMKTV